MALARIVAVVLAVSGVVLLLLVWGSWGEPPRSESLLLGVTGILTLGFGVILWMRR
jgi:hypothetical protein